jgi:1-deoxy-D-xylulose-5-phosphate synthase
MRALPVGQGEIRRRAGVWRCWRLAAWCSRRSGGGTVGCHRGQHALYQAAGRGAVVALAAGHRCLVTLEENVVAGGAGSAVNECLAARHDDSGAPHRLAGLLCRTG